MQSSIDTLMRDYQGAVPGASVLVLRDGVAVVRRGMGLANMERMIEATSSSNYRLASITKQFTAASILLLVEDGKLKLDDPIGKWLPGLPAVTSPITIHHLLTHSSGLIDYEDVMDQASSEQIHDVGVLHLMQKQDHLYFSPGTDYRYSNTGYALLSLIVEHASGMEFPAFLKQRIFDPLGMHSTLAFVEGGPNVPNRAYGYSRINGQWVRTDQSTTSAVLGDGGIYASIDDLAKWDAALYDDRLLSDTSRQLAFTPHTKTDDPTVEYGYGWRISGDTLWHSGESIGFRNVIVRWPKQHVTVIILSNRNDPEPYATALAIGQAVIGDW